LNVRITQKTSGQNKKGRNWEVNTHGKNTDEGILLGVDLGLDFFLDLEVGGLKIVTGFTSVIHERDETFFVHIDELQFCSLDDWALHVVSGRADIFEFLVVYKQALSYVYKLIFFGLLKIKCIGRLVLNRHFESLTNVESRNYYRHEC